MENTIKKLTKEELQNLTKDQLEEMKADCYKEGVKYYDKCKQHFKYLEEVINEWLNQFNIKCKVKYLNVINHISEYELDKHSNSTYKVTFDVKLIDENNETSFNDSFSLKVYDNELSGSIGFASDVNRNSISFTWFE